MIGFKNQIQYLSEISGRLDLKSTRIYSSESQGVFPRINMSIYLQA